MKPGNPEAVKAPYKGPPVSARNKWYHINGVKRYLEKMGVPEHRHHAEATCFLMDTGKTNSHISWNRTAIKVQNHWDEFAAWCKERRALRANRPTTLTP